LVKKTEEILGVKDENKNIYLIRHPFLLLENPFNGRSEKVL
jgi:hypothetical protein